MRPGGNRPLARALVLVVAAGLLRQGLVGRTVPYEDVPALVGGAFLLSACAGGRGGGLWAAGCVVGGWGAGELALRWVTAPESAVSLAGVGLGVLLLAALGRIGVRPALPAIGLAALVLGVLLGAQRTTGSPLLSGSTGVLLVLLVPAAAQVVAVRRRR